MAKIETNLDALKAVAFEATRKRTTKQGYNTMKRVAKHFHLDTSETYEFLRYMEYGYAIDHAQLVDNKPI